MSGIMLMRLGATYAPAVSVPGAPTIGTATATSSTTATVDYTAPASDGGSTILSYTATSSPGGITGTLSQAGSGTITVSGLTDNTSYTFTVTATNAIGTSSPSSASNSITTPVAWYGNLSTAALLGSFDASAQDNQPTYIIVSTDGAKAFINGATTSKIYSYSLSTYYNITSAAYLNASPSYYNTGGLIYLGGFNISPDGTKAILTGTSSGGVDGKVSLWNLSTPWDISTATYSSTTSPTEFVGKGLNGSCFSPEGTKFYALDSTNGIVYQYNSSAWSNSIGTAISSKNISAQISTNGGYGIAISADGLFFYASKFSSGVVYQYSLSTAWNISTATLLRSYTCPQPVIGISFNYNGSNLYTGAPAPYAVKQFTLGA